MSGHRSSLNEKITLCPNFDKCIWCELKTGGVVSQFQQFGWALTNSSCCLLLCNSRVDQFQIKSCRIICCQRRQCCGHWRNGGWWLTSESTFSSSAIKSNVESASDQRLSWAGDPRLPMNCAFLTQMFLCIEAAEQVPMTMVNLPSALWQMLHRSWMLHPIVL